VDKHPSLFCPSVIDKEKFLLRLTIGWFGNIHCDTFHPRLVFDGMTREELTNFKTELHSKYRCLTLASVTSVTNTLVYNGMGKVLHLARLQLFRKY
jgi:hypothetical protein